MTLTPLVLEDVLATGLELVVGNAEGISTVVMLLVAGHYARKTARIGALLEIGGLLLFALALLSLAGVVDVHLDEALEALMSLLPAF